MRTRIPLSLCLVFGTFCCGYISAQDELKKTKKALSKEVEKPERAMNREADLLVNGFRREVFKTVGEGGETELPIYILEPEGETEAGRSAIILFYGGAWNSRNISQFLPYGTYFAKRGMVVLLSDYRAANAYGGTPVDCVADARSAMRWTRAHAERLGIDPEKIVAGGGSAGGHLAAACGMLDGLDDAKDDLSVPVKPNALVLFNPVYNNGPEGGYGYARVEQIWEAFSPAANISEDDPATITFLGTNDKLIPVSTAERFDAEMKAVGLRSELHLYEGKGHGFFNPKRSVEGQITFVDIVEKADLFLASLGFLKGEPTISAEHLDTVKAEGAAKE